MSCDRFNLSLQVAPREAIRLLYISQSRFASDWHSTPHTHNCTELFYCVNGRGRFRLGDKLYSVSTGSFVIVNPMVEHTELSFRENPLEYVVLGVQGIEFLFGSNERYAVLDCRRQHEKMVFLLQSLLGEVSHQQDGYETVCQDLLEVLLYWMVRSSGSISGQRKPEQTGNKDCAAVRRYIDEHYTEPITLDQLSAIGHISKYYLSHIFAREYHVSPINYLINKRIEQSKALLESSDYSLSEISTMMGFSSASFFSQSFHRMAGMSPREYRRETQKAAQPAPEP